MSANAPETVTLGLLEEPADFGLARSLHPRPHPIGDRRPETRETDRLEGVLLPTTLGRRRSDRFELHLEEGHATSSLGYIPSLSGSQCLRREDLATACLIIQIGVKTGHPGIPSRYGTSDMVPGTVHRGRLFFGRDFCTLYQK